MQRIRVILEGVTPLLMNSPKGMLIQDDAVKLKTKKGDIKTEAEAVAYRTKQGYLYVPNTAIKGTIMGASSYKKLGKYSLKPLIASGVRIPGDEIVIKDKKGKPLKDYEIDLRTVVVQGKNRIVKARPKIENWQLDFGIVYNEQLIPDPEVIKTVLTEAGERVGLLDFRAQKSGEFGSFTIKEWKLEK